MVKLGFKKIHPNAVLPKKAHEGDAGMDVCAVEDTLLMAFRPTLVKTGLKVDIPDGYEIQVRPRSGLALKSGITVLNSPGTIDAGYKGEIGVILMMITDPHLSGWPMKITAGDKIAQLVLSKVASCEIEEIEDVGMSDRGDGGFGSTGK